MLQPFLVRDWTETTEKNAVTHINGFRCKKTKSSQNNYHDLFLWHNSNLNMGVSSNGGTPISHPKWWSFLVGKPMVVGETPILGNPHISIAGLRRPHLWLRGIQSVSAIDSWFLRFWRGPYCCLRSKIFQFSWDLWKEKSSCYLDHSVHFVRKNHKNIHINIQKGFISPFWAIFQLLQPFLVLKHQLVRGLAQKKFLRKSLKRHLSQRLFDQGIAWLSPRQSVQKQDEKIQDHAVCFFSTAPPISFMFFSQITCLRGF